MPTSPSRITTHAIADFDMAIKLNPKYAEAFFNRGMAKHNHGDIAGGEEDIAQAKLLQPGIGANSKRSI